jgi:hypothetical protein
MHLLMHAFSETNTASDPVCLDKSSACSLSGTTDLITKHTKHEEQKNCHGCRDEQRSQTPESIGKKKEHGLPSGLSIECENVLRCCETSGQRALRNRPLLLSGQPCGGEPRSMSRRPANFASDRRRHAMAFSPPLKIEEPASSIRRFGVRSIARSGDRDREAHLGCSQGPPYTQSTRMVRHRIARGRPSISHPAFGRSRLERGPKES